jgi:hypothetical protein
MKSYAFGVKRGCAVILASVKWTFVSILLAVPLLGSAFLPIAKARTGGQFVGPETWIAFIAKVRQFDAGGMLVLEGRVLRASDGSYRWEGPGRGGSRSTIIHNLKTRRSYTLSADATGWIEQPLGIPDGPYHPLRIRADNPRYVWAAIDHPQISQVLVNEKNGLRRYLAPELNLLAIRKQFPGGGREEISQIIFGEPDPTEFSPPAGENVKFDPRPGGIIRSAGR